LYGSAKAGEMNATTNKGGHQWLAEHEGGSGEVYEHYLEWNSHDRAWFQDVWTEGYWDVVMVELGAPSDPASEIRVDSPATDNDRFIDVVINP
jgi:hypothetical protein